MFDGAIATNVGFDVLDTINIGVDVVEIIDNVAASLRALRTHCILLRMLIVICPSIQMNISRNILQTKTYDLNL